MFFKLFGFSLLLANILLLFCVAGETEKNLEFGVGLLSMKMDHYRGSDQKRDVYLPFPYFTYKTENIEAETSFVRGVLHQTRNKGLTLKLGILAGLSVESEKNKARNGMNDLGYTFESGLLLVYNLYQSHDQSKILTLEWAVRQVFTIDFEKVFFKPIGQFSIAYLNYTIVPSFKTWNWGGQFSVGPMFATKKNHDFYYGVEKSMERPDRPAYESKTGYSGTQVTLILNSRFDHFVLMPFIRYDSLSGSAFIDSPLVKKKDYIIFAIGTFYFFS